MQTGGLTRHGQWNWAAVSSYLAETALLEEMLLGGLYTACGQMPRIRELLSPQSENRLPPGAAFISGMVCYLRHSTSQVEETDEQRILCRPVPNRPARACYVPVPGLHPTSRRLAAA